MRMLPTSIRSPFLITTTFGSDANAYDQSGPPSPDTYSFAPVLAANSRLPET
jgi:hypothetical protein